MFAYRIKAALGGSARCGAGGMTAEVAAITVIDFSTGGLVLAADSSQRPPTLGATPVKNNHPVSPQHRHTHTHTPH